MKRLLCLLLTGCLALSLLCGCTQAAAITNSETYDADGTIVWKGAKVDIQGTGVTLDEDGDIVIEQGGLYLLSGTSGDTHLVVKAAESEDVTLVLNGLTLTNTLDETIYIKSAASATLVLADGTENTIISGEAPVEEDTEETDADTEDTEEDASGAAIHAKCPLTITGDGALTVYGYINNGIAAKEDITIESGSLTIYAANDALKSKQNITVYGGLFRLTADKDGVQADDSLTILSGDFSITTGAGCAGATVKVGDSGMMGGGPGGGGFGGGSGEASGEASGEIAEALSQALGEASDELSWDTLQEIFSAAFDDSGAFSIDSLQEAFIQAYGQEAWDTISETLGEDFISAFSDSFNFGNSGFDMNASSEMGGSGEMGGSSEMGGSGEMGGFPGGGMPWDSDNTSSASHKGLKAENAITILSGTFLLDTEDDAIHTNGDVTISGGTFTILSGDDGIHGDTSLTISGGTIDIQSSYEGLEAPSILITDGYTSIVASDDGMNANGGSGMFGGGPGGFGGSGEASSEADSDSSSPVLRITGGTVVVDAGGDGLDSNGSIYFEGGTIYVSGPSSDWDAPIDYGEGSSQWIITGGVIMAAGYSGMAEAPESTTDSQSSIYYKMDDYADDGETAVLTDEDGNVLVQYSFVHGYNVVIVSSPDLTVGQTYTLTVGDQSYEIELTDTTYSNRSFGFGGGPGGDFGGGPSGEMSGFGGFGGSSGEMSASQETNDA